jgi:hypothetical protein
MDSLTLPIITISLSGLITIGGTVFNYYLSQRSKRLDEARQRQAEAERLAARYAKPLLQAAWELQGRLRNVLESKDRERKVLGPDWTPPADWPITHEYYLKSTLYMIGQLFAWIDIMKKEEIFLPLSNKQVNQEFQSLLDDCIKAFSDSRVAPGVSIFRQEQRAIGEQMSEESSKDKTLHCISYSTFVENYEQNERYRRWFEPALNLVLSLGEDEADPRVKRLKVVYMHLQRFVHFVNTQMGIQLAEERAPAKAVEAHVH